jgi:uncharacterized protein (TIGR00645 family)
MAAPNAAPPPRRVKPALQRTVELWLFRSRWLVAPFYFGLALALAVLLVVFFREVWDEIIGLRDITPSRAIVMALSLIDLSLVGNLLVIVIFSGYENFVAKIHTGDSEERPAWMGLIDFSGLKMKMMGSIVAISAVALLQAFVKLGEGEHIPTVEIAWLVGVHLTFVVSGLLLAIMDYVAVKTEEL